MESLLFLSEFSTCSCLMIELRSMTVSLSPHQRVQFIFFSRLPEMWAQQALKISAMVGAPGGHVQDLVNTDYCMFMKECEPSVFGFFFKCKDDT